MAGAFDRCPPCQAVLKGRRGVGWKEQLYINGQEGTLHSKRSDANGRTGGGRRNANGANASSRLCVVASEPWMDTTADGEGYVETTTRISKPMKAKVYKTWPGRWHGSDFAAKPGLVCGSKACLTLLEGLVVGRCHHERD
eukprot:1588524-Amphidinium_carterae.5